MEITTEVNEVNSVTREIAITVASEDALKILDQAYLKIGRKAHLKGFRKGKVPRYVLEQYYKGDAEREAINTMVGRSLHKAITESDLQPITEPSVKDLSEFIPGMDFKYVSTVELRPVFELPALDALTVTRTTYEVNEDAVEFELNKIQEQASSIEPVSDRDTVAQGDFVEVNLSAIDAEGNAIDSLTRPGAQLEIGKGTFFKEVEQGLVGQTAKSEHDISLTVPEDHYLEAYREKTIVVHVKVLEIKTKVRPELNDDFAQDVDEKFQTIADLRSELQNRLEREALIRSEQEARESVIDALINAQEFEVPEGLVLERAQELAIEPFRQFPQETLMQFWQMQGEQMTEQAKPKALRQVRGGFFVAKLKDELAIDIVDADVDAHFEKLAKRTGEEAGKIKLLFNQNQQMDQLKDQLLAEKALDTVLEKAKIVAEEKSIRELQQGA